MKKVVLLLYDSSLPKNYWGYALEIAAYPHNRIPSSSIHDNIPYELKHARKPNLREIKIFGCDIYIRIPDVRRRKLDSKSKRMNFVGYTNMGYRVMDSITRRAFVSRNVRFNEKKVVVNDSPSITNFKKASDNVSGEIKTKIEKEAVTAYLNGNLIETVIMFQPQGYDENLEEYANYLRNCMV